ncbi:MAG: Nif3-like dinuclear metal center hexameric protein [Burkholderiales bacterium]|nr:Nif3-like dinuclear metal center hexameric protein [Burkholderiales bacterium]
MQREELNRYLDGLLEISRYQDYCPNGLQVEGRDAIRRVVSGVTASFELVQAALAHGADAILVHHGYFWKGEDPCLTGTRRARIALLMANELNLFAYHLPLDAHAELGNNAQLGNRLGLTQTARFADQEIGFFGSLDAPMRLDVFAARVQQRLGREPLVIGDPAREVRNIAWCTGAAQGFFEAAIRLRADAYLSGEISEQQVHLARESGIAFIAAGHHATEKYGVQALGEHLSAQFGLEHRYIDIPNPV